MVNLLKNKVFASKFTNEVVVTSLWGKILSISYILLPQTSNKSGKSPSNKDKYFYNSSGPIHGSYSFLLTIPVFYGSTGMRKPVQ